MPESCKSSYFPELTLKPLLSLLISATTTSPLKPAFFAICLVGSKGLLLLYLSLFLNHRMIFDLNLKGHLIFQLKFVHLQRLHPLQ